MIQLLTESSGIRAISRITKLHQETVLKILRLAGKISHKFMDGKIKGLKCEVVQADEIHSIVYAKDWGLKEKHDGRGSQYTFISVDAKSRLIINSYTGLRNEDSTMKFLSTLKKRVNGRFQINTDAWSGYTSRGRNPNCIRRAFGEDIDHATEEKEFYKLNQFVTRKLSKTNRKSRIGNPDLNRASTSYIERINLSMRLFNRRFTRCTLGFSKKLMNHRYAINLFMWNHNFARKHDTIKTTPAIACGISFVTMTIEELWKYNG
ncbi:MAG TPA: hypothetical protein VHG89_05975 [Verrucomicrobiae bacterium]|nr:hypothetical protein [Verrucomicrobiae bacterium]